MVNENNEALAILQEFVEIPDNVKFVQLARLMNHGDGYGEKAKKEFAEMMRTLPVDLVNPKISLNSDSHLTQVSTNSVGDDGTLLQEAVHRNKQDFVRILLEYGFVYFALPKLSFPSFQG